MEAVDQAQEQVSTLIRNMRPVEIDAAALQAALAELTVSIQRRRGIRCLFKCPAPGPSEDNNTATHLFRIAQEAVNNAAKHSRAKEILVSLTSEGGRTGLVIEDDGIGLPADPEPPLGMGLRIMRYRAGIIGAQLHFEPRRPQGTRVVCTLEQDE